MSFVLFFFSDTATTEIYTLSLHDALPISYVYKDYEHVGPAKFFPAKMPYINRSEEHTSELQSRQYLVCRLLLEKKKSRQWPRDRRPRAPRLLEAQRATHERCDAAAACALL